MEQRLGRVGDGDDPGRAVGEPELRLAHRELGGKLLDARSPELPGSRIASGAPAITASRSASVSPESRAFDPHDERRPARLAPRLLQKPRGHGPRPAPAGRRGASEIDNDRIRAALERLGEPLLVRRAQ